MRTEPLDPDVAGARRTRAGRRSPASASQARDDRPSPTTRVSRTFAFVDLCGFTDFVDTYGDFEGLVELTTLRRILREATLLHRARVDKWLGDGALLVALDTETMLEAVLAAGREHHGRGRLLLRGGVTEGPAILCDDDYVGAVVNLASRLCDSAAPGTILVQTSEDPRDPESTDCGERDTARRIIGRATALSLLPEAAGDRVPIDPATGAC